MNLSELMDVACSDVSSVDIQNRIWPQVLCGNALYMYTCTIQYTGIHIGPRARRALY